jgi:hypothetical protein
MVLRNQRATPSSAGMSAEARVAELDETRMASVST